MWRKLIVCTAIIDTLHPMSKNFLGEHPILYRTVAPSHEHTSPTRPKPSPPIDIESLASELIAEQNDRIYDLEMRIMAYEVKIEEEAATNLDHSPAIAALEAQVRSCRAEETRILEQIQNCRKVENQVTPMEYYLWKKKQRVNTYDASIAELCREVEQQREYLQRSIEEHRRLNEQLLGEIDELEERIAKFSLSPRESRAPPEPQEAELEELFGENIALRQEISALKANSPFFQENVEILEAQVIDNADSTAAALRAHFEEEKTRLVREFKQLQAESRQLEVSPLTREEQAYSIDPLLNDYAHKMNELAALLPDKDRKAAPILLPLPWKTFNWTEFLNLAPGTENVYEEYTKLEKEFISSTKEIEQLQLQLRKVNTEIANEQQKFNQIFTNISKLKKKLDK